MVVNSIRDSDWLTFTLTACLLPGNSKLSLVSQAYARKQSMNNYSEDFKNKKFQENWQENKINI